MPNLKGMNVEALMKLRNQVDERLLTVAIGVGVGIALAIIGYLLHWISSWWGSTYRSPSDETWAGRGARPRWLVAAIKGGKKLDDFLIEKSGQKGRRKRRSKRWASSPFVICSNRHFSFVALLKLVVDTNPNPTRIE
jgi:H-NS histone family